MRDNSPHPTCRSLLDEQLRLLADRREDAAALMERGGERDQDLVDRIADDVVGARLVILAALMEASPPLRGLSGAERDELERREREARDLLRAVLASLCPRRGADGRT